MRTHVHPLSTILNEKHQWVVPVYQRHYEWETGQDKQLPKLWDNLREKAIDRLDERTHFPHYFGAIIYSEAANQSFGTVHQRFLVDGQQRITSFQLALAAIREVAKKHHIVRLIDVINEYLYNPCSPGMVDPSREKYKLWPSMFDRSLYQDIIDNSPDQLREIQRKFFFLNGNLRKGQSPKLLRAFWYLYNEMKIFVSEREEDGKNSEEVLDALLVGFLSGFRIVIIQLDANDDAQEIFASLNGLGKPLSPFDLIRNDVFHRAQKTGEDYERIFDDQWKVFEQPYWSEFVRQGRFKRARANHLIAHAVVAETARDVNVGKIAAEYQHYAHERRFLTVTEELDILLGHASTYRTMEEKSDGSPVAQIAKVLRIWDMSTFHPLIFWINAQSFRDNQKSKLFGLLESYIVRREICRLTSKNYNRVVTSIIRYARKKDDQVSAIFKYINGLSGDASRMPRDSEVNEAFGSKRVYLAIPSARLRFILEQIEYAKRTKYHEVTILSGDLTIEHIMPRSWAKHWPLPNGVNAPCESTWEATSQGIILDDHTKALMELRQSAVHTFGNLTLVTKALNPSIGNAAWELKRPRLGESLLVLNRQIAEKQRWDEDAIQQRAADLAAIATGIWKMGEA